MRLFLAFELPSEVRDALGVLQARLRRTCGGWRWTRAEAIHLTIRFLGEVDADRASALSDVWRSASGRSGPIGLRLDRLGVFPTPRRPRVLWVSVQEEPDLGRLATLAAGIETAARSAGFEAEDRPFRPHLTIARSSRDGPSDMPAEAISPPELRFEARELLLFRSELRSDGAVYAVLERYPFAASGS